MPNTKPESQPSRRAADKKLDQIHTGMKAMLQIFDIDIEATAEHVHIMVTEANKDARFLRSLRRNTNQSMSHARNLTIYGFFTGLGIILLRMLHLGK